MKCIFDFIKNRNEHCEVYFAVGIPKKSSRGDVRAVKSNNHVTEVLYADGSTIRCANSNCVVVVEPVGYDT